MRLRQRVIQFGLAAMLLSLSLQVGAQQPMKVHRIGFFEGASIVESQGIEPFRQGLRELGYVEGKNVSLEIRAMEGKPDRIAPLVTELIGSKVDVIFTPNTAAAHAAKKANPSMPIVILVGDPVGSGLVTSLARPGGNVTGLSGFVELSGKRLRDSQGHSRRPHSRGRLLESDQCISRRSDQGNGNRSGRIGHQALTP